MSRSMIVDGHQSIMSDGSQRSGVERDLSIVEARRLCEGDDDTWDARVQARWDAYAASSFGRAVARLVPYAFHHSPGTPIS